MIKIDSKPGTYVLVLNSQIRAALTVGRLGQLPVRPGYYLYVGSAFGSGGLRARVAHHLRHSSSPHWHIDHLRALLPVEEVWFSTSATRLEHHWAELLSSQKSATIPLKRFGASDCRCRSHLFHFTEKPSSKLLDAKVVLIPHNGS